MSPEMTLFLIICGAALPLGTAAFLTHRDRRLPKRGKFAFYIVYLAALVTTILVGEQNYSESRNLKSRMDRLSFHGTLEPSLRISTVNNRKYLTSGGVIYSIKEGEKTGFAENDIDLLTFRVENDEIMINALIRDTNGDIVVRIVDNQWKIHPGNHWSSIQQNGIYEVLNSKGEVVLQLIHFGDVVCAQAVFTSSQGMTFAFTDSVAGYLNPPDRLSALKWWPTGTENKAGIRNIFDHDSPSTGDCGRALKIRNKVVEYLNPPLATFFLGTIDIASATPEKTENMRTLDSADGELFQTSIEIHMTPPVGAPIISAQTVSPYVPEAIQKWIEMNTAGRFTDETAPKGTREQIIEQAHCLIQLRCETLLFAKSVTCFLYEKWSDTYYASGRIIKTISPETPAIVIIDSKEYTADEFFERLGTFRPDLTPERLSITQERADGYVLVALLDPTDGEHALKLDFERVPDGTRFLAPVIYTNQVIFED